MKTEQTLYCPTCGYNLTGLPENRYPECGDLFSPDELARHAQGARPFPWKERRRYLILVPTALALGVVVAGALSAALLFVTLLVVVPVAFINAFDFAERMVRHVRFQTRRGPGGVCNGIQWLSASLAMIGWQSFVISALVHLTGADCVS